MDKVYYFSAPGRIEISGNHTDHQHGCVLAAAVNMETTAEVTLNGTNIIRVDSEGYQPVSIDIDDLAVKESEKNTTASLIRGVAAAFVSHGYRLSGFDARIRSTVLPGSGLSSSAAFEVLIGRILNGLFADNAFSDIDIARIGQYAENVYYGKPSGLMDQMASSVGGLVFIDFADPAKPVVEKIDWDFENSGYTVCTIDSGAGHDDLTEEYAAIPSDMKSVAAQFGKEFLRDVSEAEFYNGLSSVRMAVGDRAVLRAVHFYNENRRVQEQVLAMRCGDFGTFLQKVNESGLSSWTLLQNIAPTGSTIHQELALTIALCRELIGTDGAVRVNGGGFAGTVLVFVRNDRFADFQRRIEALLGQGHCHKLAIR